jgi:hypothetical protein
VTLSATLAHPGLGFHTLAVIQGTFGVIQGTFGVIQGTFGVIQGKGKAHPAIMIRSRLFLVEVIVSLFMQLYTFIY